MSMFTTRYLADLVLEKYENIIYFYSGELEMYFRRMWDKIKVNLGHML